MYRMESGGYPPGAEFDPRAPYNEKTPPMWECRYCGEEQEEVEGEHFHGVGGNDVCRACLPEALDLALVEHDKLERELKRLRDDIAKPIERMR